MSLFPIISKYLTKKYEKVKEIKINTKSMSSFLIIIFILQLIPLILISKYNSPSVDDYSFGAATRMVWQNTHSLTALTRCAIENAREVYMNWQGPFTVNFLLAFQPAIFGEQYYFFVAIIILGTMCFGTMLFCNAVLENMRGGGSKIKEKV